MDQRFEQYFQRPNSEREAFAHRFSDEWRNRLAKEKKLPSDRRFDEVRLRNEGVDPAWFRPENPDDNQTGVPIC